MTKVLGMGNALVDVLVKLDNDSQLGQLSLPKGSMQIVDREDAGRLFQAVNNFGSFMASGGSAANTIHGLSNLGIATGFFGRIGSDELGKFYRDDMIQAGISAVLLEENGETGRALALITPDSERTFATYLGVAANLVFEDLPPSLFRGYEYFHVEGYLVQNRALISQSISMAKKAGLRISLDLASYNVVAENLEFLRQLVSESVDIVFANEDEARVFTGGLVGKQALIWMSNMCPVVVLKQGEKGSMVSSGNEIASAGVYDAKLLDTTGAGDMYAAGFLYGLINGYPTERCAKTGALLAARVIEIMGPKLDAGQWEQIRHRLMEDGF